MNETGHPNRRNDRRHNPSSTVSKTAATVPSTHGSENDTSSSRADRVYSWAVNELSYPLEGPRNDQDKYSRSLFSRTPRSNTTSLRPDHLSRICEGPLGPMFDYLAENMKRRSQSYDEQTGHGESAASRTVVADTNHKKRIMLVQERQARDTRCRELIQAIAQKQSEIAKAKLRIKWERQRQVQKEIYRKQSARQTRVLQEFQSLLKRIETCSSADESCPTNNENFLRITQELSRTIVADISDLVGNITLDTTLSQGHSYLRQPTEELYNVVRQSSGSTIAFMKMANELKLQILRSSQTLSDPSSGSEATGLLKLFHEHHLERVAQIESVGEKILSIEQEKERLYTQMRLLSKEREQDVNVSNNLQELEEAKARLKGLLMALEFIQDEQENLVERVVPLEEQYIKLDEMTKAFRIADKKLLQSRQAIECLIEMIRLHLQDVLSVADTFSKEVKTCISQDLALLSNTIDRKKGAIEDDSKLFDHLLTQSQQGSSAKQSEQLATWRSTENLSKESNAIGSATLSADRRALHLLELQRQNLARSHSMATTDSAISATEQFRARTTESVVTSAQGIRLEVEELCKRNSGNEQSTEHSSKKIRSGSSSVTFGEGFQEAVEDLIECDSNYQTSYEERLQGVLSRVDAGEKQAGGVQILLEDYERLQTIPGLSNVD